MPVPEHIRRVPRPVNTIVSDNGGFSALRFCVRERKGSRTNANGKSMPVNGRVIGHIINDVFVPLNEPLQRQPQFLSFGSAALANSVTDDLLADLLHCFHPAEAFDILVMALLRVLRPHIKAKRYVSEYECSYLSVWYPAVSLSKNKISDLQIKLGMNKDKRTEFNKLRLEQVCAEHHVAIDGTLKQDTSRVNNFSAYSRKAKVKGIKEISILYAFDIETMEPVCAEVFQGNSIDATSYSAFIRDNQLSRGIILADKGFPASAAKQEIARFRELHYLNPIKRSDSRIERFDMLNFNEQLYALEAEVVCKKQLLPDGTFLYSFRDNRRFAAESRSFLERSRKQQNFDPEDYSRREKRFGLIVFESDVALSCLDVWKCYRERWLLELMFAQFKGDEGLNSTCVQSDFALQGSEFINFIATIITSRITRRLEKAGLLDEDSYSDVMTDLSRVRRSVNAPKDELPARDDLYWDQNPLKGAFEMLESLGLCKPSPEVQKPRGKPGRPRKREQNDQAQSAAAQEVKHPRGRPRIHPKPDPNAPKRPRGRPPKPKDAATQPKRPRGRPRIRPVPDPNTPRRPRGRPRKNPLST